MESLIYDLSFGMRLPTPKCCPDQIENLLRKCFFTKPDERPDFKDVKVLLESGYQSLYFKPKKTQTPLNHQYVQMDTPALNKVKSPAMKNRYDAVLIRNQNVVKENLKHIETKPPTTVEVISEVHFPTIRDFPKSDGLYSIETAKINKSLSDVAADQLNWLLVPSYKNIKRYHTLPNLHNPKLYPNGKAKSLISFT